MQLTGNKQEWGKVYAFLTLLLQRNCDMGDHHLRVRNDRTLQIQAIARVIEGGLVQADPTEKGWLFDINTTFEQKKVEYSNEEIQKLQEELLSKIKSDDDTFSCQPVDEFLSSIGIYEFSSFSESGEDFTITFFQPYTGQILKKTVRLHSLLNRHYLMASNRAANFKFDITQVKLSNPEANKINAMGDDESGPITRLNEIFRLGGRLKYTGVEGKFFQSALQLIDMHEARLMGEMVRLFYTGESITIKDLTAELNEINLFKVKDEVISKSRIYEYKIRQLLYAAACGLKPSKTWRGYHNADMQIYATSTGELRAYDIFEKENFERFLWSNTRLSLANENKGKYGQIEKENGQFLIKLNLEICFI